MSKESTILDLEKLKTELLERVRQIDITINTIRTLSIGGSVTLSPVLGTDVSNRYKDYDPKASFRTKIGYVITKEGRFLHVREIAKVIHDIEPSTSIKDLTKKISPAVSHLRRTGKIVKFKVGKSNVNSFWGSKSWLDDNGKPKEGREYNDEYIVKASDINIE